jgi:hypothetical protein
MELPWSFCTYRIWILFQSQEQNLRNLQLIQSKARTQKSRAWIFEALKN